MTSTTPLTNPNGTAEDGRIEELRRSRPKSWTSRLSLWGILIIVLYAWIGGDFRFDRFLDDRSMSNLSRFLGEIRPHPLWDRPFDFGVFVSWIGDTLSGKGQDAILTTLAISVAAITLAGFGGLLFSIPAARNLANSEPFLPGVSRANRVVRLAWRSLVGASRFALIFTRALPEYVWAFLLVALLGPGAWPAVLALAIHNFGILGKLGSEVFENVEPQTPRALRGMGASRVQVASFAMLPPNLGRFLLYFFYRWETCVREATVLGLLGVVSLGWYIQDSRARVHYDEMILFVMLGAALILIGDLVSAVARGMIRRAG